MTQNGCEELGSDIGANSLPAPLIGRGVSLPNRQPQSLAIRNADLCAYSNASSWQRACIAASRLPHSRGPVFGLYAGAVGERPQPWLSRRRRCSFQSTPGNDFTVHADDIISPSGPTAGGRLSDARRSRSEGTTRGRERLECQYHAAVWGAKAKALSH